MELHELMMFKTTCMTKSSTMQKLAEDEELRTLMQQDAEQSSRAVNALQTLLSRTQS
ncbi:spore coat protein [Paenibacillus xerothermodurans]|nr:spore coat protein [Paenibacillus xerothermodurans]